MVASLEGRIFCLCASDLSTGDAAERVNSVPATMTRPVNKLWRPSPEPSSLPWLCAAAASSLDVCHNECRAPPGARFRHRREEGGVAASRCACGRLRSLNSVSAMPAMEKFGEKVVDPRRTKAREVSGGTRSVLYRVGGPRACACCRCL